MREKNKLRGTASNPALPTRLTDLPVTPGESFRLRKMVTAWRGRLHLVLHPYKKPQELTSTELASIEARVRKELYP
jgi:hypothetical protein